MGFKFTTAPWINSKIDLSVHVFLVDPSENVSVIFRTSARPVSGFCYSNFLVWRISYCRWKKMRKSVCGFFLCAFFWLMAERFGRRGCRKKRGIEIYRSSNQNKILKMFWIIHVHVTFRRRLSRRFQFEFIRFIRNWNGGVGMV